jgi:cell division septum initiation protein DivIVA
MPKETLKKFKTENREALQEIKKLEKDVNKLDTTTLKDVLDAIKNIQPVQVVAQNATPVENNTPNDTTESFSMKRVQI